MARTRFLLLVSMVDWLLAFVVASDQRNHFQPLVDRAIDGNTQHYYLGYHANDYKTPWAKYFNDTSPVFSANFSTGLESSPVPAQLGLAFADAPKALNQPGYLPVENGYTILKDGTLTLATRVDVPSDFTGEMYDFWFSWHINDTTKYKLWNPNAHQYAAVDPIPLQKRSQPSYRNRYWNITSFVDEYIGDTPYKLSIGFFDPSLLGFSTTTEDTGVETIVTAFVNLFTYTENHPASQAAKGFTPLSAVLAHQVRRRPDGKGKEIRSRFWFGPLLTAGMNFVGGPLEMAKELSIHCFTEMSQLGTFLPALYDEFKSDIITTQE